MESNRNAKQPEFFSRGSTPPVTQPVTQSFQNPRNPPASSTHIESLFHKLAGSSDSSHQVEDSAPKRDLQSSEISSSTPNASSMLLSTDEQLSPPISTGSLASNSERHTALLSLLSPPSARGALPPAPQTHQIPTPPGSSQRSGASPSYNDAKMLLDQLMQGCVSQPRSDSCFPCIYTCLPC